jgi:T-complex protein 1 subunit zeta
MATRETNLINPNAEVVASSQCLLVNVAAARGLQAVLKTNLGPRGTLKMLVGGAGQIKITKDGNVLLHEMQIQHPTAMMIARAATAMDDEVGDGTTSSVLFIGELLKQAERFTSEGLHPRLITEGYEAARDMVLDFLDAFKVPVTNAFHDKELLTAVARTSLRSKLSADVADTMADAIVDSIRSIAVEGRPIDLHMVEIMEMQHKKASDSTFVPGIVLDHGVRHPDMPKSLENAYILTCNVSMEYEKTEINASFYYSSAEQREKLVDSERRFTDEKVRQVIELKRRVCPEGSGKTFCVINQKGIDPPSLDMLAKEGIMALRRAKRRNMERLVLACGGTAVNAVDDLDESVLGHADRIHEEVLGDDRFTFVENHVHADKAKSCTLLLRGPNKHTIDQLKDAARDGLRAVKAVIEDGALVPGAGAFEIAAYRMLQRRKSAVTGKAKLGLEAFSQALLVIPKTLAENSGLDVQDSVLKVEEEQERTEQAVGLDVQTGEPFLPASVGVWDSVLVKKQVISLATVLATQLLLVDEVMKAGKAMGKKATPEDAMDME